LPLNIKLGKIIQWQCWYKTGIDFGNKWEEWSREKLSVWTGEQYEMEVAWKWYEQIRVNVMVYNTTFNNISVILWHLVLLLEETRVPGENQQPVASHWQTLSHIVVLSTSCHEQDSNSQR
jgi:hypothetical protein